ncbi:HAD hydrolase-like protein [candidate division KSB1 bacterium]|nr:HAD hydrolase-like protein [candidate division KSB1 bacterium]
MDGVITQTAGLHMKAWNKMFTEYLDQLNKQSDKAIKPYNGKQDYLKYLDGKPRYKGVESLLQSRDIDLPYGDPDDDPDKETVCGLGNRKNKIFLELLGQEGVEVYPDAIQKIKHWRKYGLKMGVVSSSKNCAHVLRAAEIEHLFEIRVDGVVAQEKELQGKPAPQLFIYATNELKSDSFHTAIFEDSVSGVKAGKQGGFKFVVGVARHGSKDQLMKNGADIVIENFDEL